MFFSSRSETAARSARRAKDAAIIFGWGSRQLLEEEGGGDKVASSAASGERGASSPTRPASPSHPRPPPCFASRPRPLLFPGRLERGAGMSYRRPGSRPLVAFAWKTRASLPTFLG